MSSQALTTVRDLLNVAESVKFPQVKNSQFKSIYQCENLVKLQATIISDRSVSEFSVEVRYTKKNKENEKKLHTCRDTNSCYAFL